MARYCAIPRDYLSDTPYCALWGFWCLNMANWVRPLPFFCAFPPGEHAKKWRCDTLPPSKGVSQRHLRDTLRKQGKWVRCPPLRYYLDRVLQAIWGGVSRIGPLRKCFVASPPPKIGLKLNRYPEGPARQIDVSRLPTVSRQFLTRNYPHPNCLLKCLPNCLSPTQRTLPYKKHYG